MDKVAVDAFVIQMKKLTAEVARVAEAVEKIAMYQEPAMPMPRKADAPKHLQEFANEANDPTAAPHIAK